MRDKLLEMPRHRSYVPRKEHAILGRGQFKNVGIAHAVRNHSRGAAIIESRLTPLQSAPYVWIKICIRLKPDLQADFRKSSRAR